MGLDKIFLRPNINAMDWVDSQLTRGYNLVGEIYSAKHICFSQVSYIIVIVKSTTYCDVYTSASPTMGCKSRNIGVKLFSCLCHARLRRLQVEVLTRNKISVSNEKSIR